MSAERFIITTSVDGRSYRKIWASSTPLVLDAPFNLKIHRSRKGVEVETVPSEAELQMGYEKQRRAFEFGDEVPQKGFDLTLRRSARGDAGLVVNILPVANISPVYQAEHGAMDMRLWGQHAIAGPDASADPMFVFSCAGSTVQSMERLSHKFTGFEGRKARFRLRKIKHGIYQIRALTDELEIKTPHRIFRLEKKAESRPFSEGELGQSVISSGSSSWYFARCPQLKAEKGPADPKDAETLWFRFALQAAAIGFFTLMSIAITWPQAQKKAALKFVETSVAEKPIEVARTEEDVVPKFEPSKFEVATLDTGYRAAVDAEPNRAPAAITPLRLTPEEERAYALEPERGAAETALASAESPAETLSETVKETYIPQTPIEATMYQYVDRFTECYERALTADGSIAGGATLTWTINKYGRASNVRVAESELRNEGLHRCLRKEISRIAFASPKGGAVTVKYPFNFSSSTE